MIEGDSKPYGTVLVKAAEILSCLAERDGSMGINEIARVTGINKPTAYKVLSTLQQLEFVHKNAKSAEYSLGIGLLKIARAALSKVDLIRIASPHLQLLNEQTGETVHLGVLDNYRVAYVSKLESKQSIRMYSRVGTTAPLYCTGIGKALLSCISEIEFEEYVAKTELVPYTNSTITTTEGLHQEVEKIRRNGYAIDDSEHEDEVRCIAVPLQAEGRLFGALSLSVPSYRMDDATLQGFLPVVMATKAAIIEDLQVLV